MIPADEQSSVHELDLKHLACPLPVLKTKNFIKKLTPGDLLIVVATDPSSIVDFKVFCEVTGHTLEQCSESDETYRFHIRVQT
jgi:tRNA 2-thiouridine synthesizing protein A